MHAGVGEPLGREPGAHVTPDICRREMRGEKVHQGTPEPVGKKAQPGSGACRGGRWPVGPRDVLSLTHMVFF